LNNKWKTNLNQYHLLTEFIGNIKNY